MSFMPVDYCLRILSEIQIISWILIPPLSALADANNDSFSHFLIELANLASGMRLHTVDSTVINVIAFLYCGAILFFDFYYILSFFLKKSIMSQVNQAWRYLLTVHHLFVFSLIYDYSLNQFSIALKTSTLTALTYISLAIFTIFHGYISSKYAFESMEGEYRLASRSSILHSTGFLYKLVVIPLTLFLEKEVNKWMQPVISMIFLSSRLVMALNRHPIYNRKIQSIFFAFCWMEACLAFLSFVFAVLGTDISVFSYTILFIALACIKLNSSYLNWAANKLITQPLNEITTLNEFYGKITALQYLFSEGDVSLLMQNERSENPQNLLFLGIITEHSKKCSLQTCGCKIVLDIEIGVENLVSRADQKSRINALIFKIINETYMLAIQKTNHPSLKMAYANFLLSGQSKAILAASLILHSINHRNLDLTSKLIRAYLIKILESKLHKDHLSEAHIVDARKFYDYECLKEEIEDLILQNVERYINFWELYKSPNIKIRQLIFETEKINKCTSKISKKWNMLKKIHQTGSSESINYSIYMSLVANAPYTAKQSIKAILYGKTRFSQKSYDQGISSINVDPSQDSYIYFSLKSGKLTRAVINKNLLGYSSALSLVGEDIRILMPKTLKKLYNNYLENPLQYDQDEIVYKTHLIPLAGRDGHLYPCLISLAPLSYLLEDVQIMAIARQLDSDDQFITLTYDGIIEGYSPNLSSFINPEGIPNQNLDIRQTIQQSNHIITLVSQFSKRQSTKQTICSAFNSNKNCLTNFDNNKTRGHSIDDFVEPDLGQEGVRKEFLVEFTRTNAQKNSEDNNSYTFLTEVLESSSYPYVILRLQKQDIKKKNARNVNELSQEDRESNHLLANNTKNSAYFPSILSRKSDNISKRPISFQKIVLEKQIELEYNKQKILDKKKRISEISNNMINYLQNHNTTGSMEEKFRMIPEIEGSRSSVYSSSTEAIREQKLEQAIYTEKTTIPLKALNISMLGHVIFTICLLVGYLSYTNYRIGQIPYVMEFIEHHRTKVYWTYDNYWNAWLAKNIIEGRLSEGFGHSGLDHWNWLFEFYSHDGNMILETNRKSEALIGYLEPNLKTVMYRPLKVIQNYDKTIRYSNMFELSNLLGNAAIRYYSTYTGVIYPPADDPINEFMRINSLNDLLVINEELFGLLADDVVKKLDSIEMFIGKALLIILGFSVVIFGLTCLMELNYKRHKIYFAESFIKINDHHVSEILEKAKLLKKLVQEEDRNHISLEKLNFVRKLRENKSKNTAKTFTRKSIDISGLNTKTYIFLGLLLIFQLAIGSICFIVYRIFVSGKEQATTQIQRITDLNRVLFTFSSTFLTLYEYLTTDGSSLIRNKPLSEEWEKDFDKLSESSAFFFSLREGDANTTSSIDYLLHGDLCKVLFVSDDCTFEIPRTGIMGMNSFVLNGIEDIKKSYEMSNRTEEAKKEALSMKIFRDVELVHFNNALIAYEEIQAILKNNMFKSLENVKDKSLSIIILFISCFVLFTRFIWVPIWRDFLRERNAFNRILRIIPIEIIIKNTYLRNFLVLYAGNILFSIRDLV